MRIAERVGVAERITGETRVTVRVDLAGAGCPDIDTGLGFLDHMLGALAMHSRIGMTVKCVGDLDVDDHHTVEDCALTLGAAMDQALGERRGVRRFGYAYAPLDESLARVVIDLSCRPSATVALGLQRERLGDVSCENLTHFFQSLSTTLRCSLHVDVLRGSNDHHKAEAAFKACAMALRAAVELDGVGVPSTKGSLS
jgi:imidazoleglycerol phosphate dehydratase HisB